MVGMFLAYISSLLKENFACINTAMSACKPYILNFDCFWFYSVSGCIASLQDFLKFPWLLPDHIFQVRFSLIDLTSGHGKNSNL